MMWHQNLYEATTPTQVGRVTRGMPLTDQRFRQRAQPDSDDRIGDVRMTRRPAPVRSLVAERSHDLAAELLTGVVRQGQSRSGTHATPGCCWQPEAATCIDR